MALRPLPFSDPCRLVWFTEVLHGSSADALTLTPHFLEWRRQAKSFDSIAAYNYQVRNLTGAGDPVEVQSARISATLLPMIGAEPALGRNFTAAEDSKGNDRVAILSHRLWQSRFASDASVVGRSITLDGTLYTVTGVLRPGFVFPGLDAVDLVTPIAKDEAELAYGPALTIVSNVIAKLRTGVTIDRAHTEIMAIDSTLPRPPWAKAVTIDMRPLRDRLYGNAKSAGWILLAGAGFILWIACANVSNLLLAELTQRHRELAIRAALGGSRARLIAQLIAESSLLASLACGLGIAIAFALRRPILALSPYKFAGYESLPIDSRVLAFAALVGAVTVLLFGILPAFRATQRGLAGAMKASESAIAGGRGSKRLLSALATAEIAMLLILATGAGLTLQSFWRMRYRDTGIQSDHLTAAAIRLSGPLYRSDAQRFDFMQALLERARAIPGVESAALTNSSEIPPGGSHATNVFQVEGRPVVPMSSGQRPIARFPRASAGLFEMFHIPLLQGKLPNHSHAVVVNSALVRKYFPNEDPIGHRVRFGAPDAQWVEIVGVVGDVKLSGLDAAPEPAIYSAYDRSNAFADLGLILKSPLPPGSLAADLRRAISTIDPNQPISTIESIDERLADSASRPRFIALLLSAFAAIAGVLGSSACTA